MWFKNLRAYRMTRGLEFSAEQLEEKLSSREFKACTPAQPLSVGWVPALGAGAQTLVHSADGRLMICLRREEKILPPSVVRDLVKERVEGIEAQQGRKVYRKEKLSLKDEVTQDCLPRAFSRHSELRLIIDPQARWVLVDSASASRAEEALNLLRECVGSFPVILPQTAHAPAAAMTSWLAHSSLPEDLQARDECELRDVGEQAAVVRCRGLELYSDEVRQHLQGTTQVVRIALGWNEQLQFVLGDDLCLRRLKFSESLVKENDELMDEDRLARMDADFALMAPTLTAIQDRLIALFGGEDNG
ncbi:recombination-associated protein RdgC [Congregibacter sp.]|nr:recombination-associated protein RdgC [Congregibacter sp.]MDA8961963.1 recombination-associated protein RdgC [Congregibacter sp.]